MVDSKLKKIRKTLLIILPLIVVGFFNFNFNQAEAYILYSEMLVSTNLLSGITDIESIDSFYYNASQIPASTTLKVQFATSSDSGPWVNANNTPDGWTDMTSTSGGTIDLSTLSWSGSDFYYKIQFESETSTTPILTQVKVNYTLAEQFVEHQSIFVIDDYGRIGIGKNTPTSILDVYANSTNTALTVKQDGSGDIIDFRNSTGSVLTILNNGYVGIGTSTPGFLLTIDTGATSTTGLAVHGSIIASGSITSDTGLDIAERFLIDPDCLENNDCPEPGDLVSIKENETIRKSLISYDPKLIGVVSDNPAIIMAGGLNSTSSLAVALAGRLKVNLSLENGDIQIGDLITSASSTPGLAMKATEPGRVIGIALENYNDQSETNQVLIFINPHWSIGSLTDNGLPEQDLTIDSSTTTENEQDEQDKQFSILDQFTLLIKNNVQKLGFWIENGVARLQKIFIKEICLEDGENEPICLNKDQLKELKRLLGETDNDSIENVDEQIEDENNSQPEDDEDDLSEESDSLTESVCRQENLSLCSDIESCQLNNGYWHNDYCSSQEPEELGESEEPKEPEECFPDWQCSDWQPEITADSCGQTINQTRTCLDLNECGIDQDRPSESQEIILDDCPEENNNQENQDNDSTD